MFYGIIHPIIYYRAPTSPIKHGCKTVHTHTHPQSHCQWMWIQASVSLNLAQADSNFCLQITFQWVHKSASSLRLTLPQPLSLSLSFSLSSPLSPSLLLSQALWVNEKQGGRNQGGYVCWVVKQSETHTSACTKHAVKFTLALKGKGKHLRSV